VPQPSLQSGNHGWSKN